MYYMYLSEERGSSGQNAVCCFGLSAQMTPFGTIRHFFGMTRLHASRLIRCLLGRQRSDLIGVGWGSS